MWLCCHAGTSKKGGDVMCVVLPNAFNEAFSDSTFSLFSSTWCRSPIPSTCQRKTHSKYSRPGDLHPNTSLCPVVCPSTSITTSAPPRTPVVPTLGFSSSSSSRSRCAARLAAAKRSDGMSMLGGRHNTNKMGTMRCFWLNPVLFISKNKPSNR